MNEKSTLFLFNLSMDLDNPILATTNLWVNEFAKNFENVRVYSTHVGRFEVPNNVRVTELGGGSLRTRIFALVKLVKAAFIIIRLRRSSVVFHHQSPITSMFPGFFLYLARVKQGLWYSHSSKPISLTVGARFVNKIFSSSPQSLPMSSRKANFLRHGIDTVSADRASEKVKLRKNDILFVGRISPIKTLEECIEALGFIGNKKTLFVVAGPTDNQGNYLNQLIDLSSDRGVKFIRLSPINHDLVFEMMAEYNMFFAGMKNSVDKSCLEAAASGCFVITTDKASADLSGMTNFWQEINGSVNLPALSEQIRTISDIKPEKIEAFRRELRRRAIGSNAAIKLIATISLKLKEI